jgi:transcriptional regulator with XRE-family HTH domain
MSNIVSGRQIRAARMLAGLTQADLARAAGCHPRSVRYWESKGNNPPTNVVSTCDSIEQALTGYAANAPLGLSECEDEVRYAALRGLIGSPHRRGLGPSVSMPAFDESHDSRKQSRGDWRGPRVSNV